MIEKLEALAALRTTGTMGQAASTLRITQSAVSKRIAALTSWEGHNDTTSFEKDIITIVHTKFVLDGSR